MNNFLNQKYCSRCKKVLSARIMSKMNEDVLCIDCADAEKQHPLYAKAAEAELEQVKAGEYNYPGLFAGQKYPFE